MTREFPPDPVIVYADVSCPFAYVGLTTLFEIRTLLHREDVDVLVLAWPLQWVNGLALDATHAAMSMTQLRRQVTPRLFRSPPDDFPTSTLPALALTTAAYRQSIPAGERMAMEIRRALFERGEDLTDPEVLGALAATEALEGRPWETVGPVRDEADEGHRLGVVGSPHFFCGSRDMFCPSLDIDRPAGHVMRLHHRVDRISEFLQGCVTGRAEVVAS